MIYRSFLAIAALTLSGCASLGPLNPLAGVERSMLFHPTPYDHIPVGPDFESVQISINDSEKIHGLLLEHPSSRGVLLFCHGNAGNVVDRLQRLRELRSEYALTVLGFDYRGFGASEGKPSESAMYADGRAARAWLARRTNVTEADIILLGRSLGGAVAVELATDGAKGLVLESTFTSVADVGQSHLKLLPVSMIVTQRFDSVSKIAQYDGPLLQVHGTVDKVVPFELGEKLFDAATSRKTFVKHHGGHNSAPGDEYENQLALFMDSVTGTSCP